MALLPGAPSVFISLGEVLRLGKPMPCGRTSSLSRSCTLGTLSPVLRPETFIKHYTVSEFGSVFAGRRAAPPSVAAEQKAAGTGS